MQTMTESVQKIIDMKEKLYINKSDSKNVLRFCASELSIPKNALNVSAVFGSCQKTGSTETFNKCVGLPYGFSYEMPIGKDELSKLRKIEQDMIIGKNKPSLYEPNYLYSYDEFVKYYNDEKFIEPYSEEDDNDEVYDETYDDKEELIEELTYNCDITDTFTEPIIMEDDEDYEGDIGE